MENNWCAKKVPIAFEALLVMRFLKDEIFQTARLADSYYL